MTYDLIIIGGGPAGAAAAVYAARKQLKTALITTDFGGQSIVSPEIQNWIGDMAISGEELAKKLQDHIKQYEGEFLEIKAGEKAVSTTKTSTGFSITSDKGNSYEGRALFIATGGRRRKLEIPGAAEFDQKGLTYCASCDGPLFAGAEVVVIGGGNAGLESAAQLLAYAKTVFLIHKYQEFKGDQITADKLRKNPKFHPILHAEPVEIKGNKFVNALVYKDLESGETKELPVTGIFVEIGFIPNTEFIKELVSLNQFGAVPVDAKTQMTSTTGIWAAGDCTDGLYHQNNIAAGDAVKAVEDLYLWLHKTSR